MQQPIISQFGKSDFFKERMRLVFKNFGKESLANSKKYHFKIKWVIKSFCYFVDTFQNSLNQIPLMKPNIPTPGS